LIPESFVQELLARVDVADVVGRYVQLRKGGVNLLGLCPFHNEKTPSFTVSPSKQFYHCFGCGAHGSALTFLMEHTGASFPEAVRTLAASAGMAVPDTPRSPAQRRQDQIRKEELSRHQQVLVDAQAHYVRNLAVWTQAKDYLNQRGISDEIARQYGLGWAGAGRRGLSQVFEHYDDNVLVEAGLVIEAEDGSRYDRFRERLMFPIRNTRGNIIGFGGRIIAKGEPKYLNSPETLLFSKGNELYGLWEARSAINTAHHVLVVEGYMDVVSLAQQGITNAVATLGTSTTTQHVHKLLRASDRVVFSFDGDAAGRKAAWRALQVCLPLLRDDVSLRFLFLPQGHDPDSFVREQGAAAFQEAVTAALPLSRFLLDELASHHNLHEAEGRAACVHEAKPLISQIQAEVLRVQIEHEFARQMRLTPEELAQMLAATPTAARTDTQSSSFNQTNSAANAPAQTSARPRPAPGMRASSGSQSRRVMPLAKHLLRLLCMHPELAHDLIEPQLEVLERGGEHLHLVRELISLISLHDARHLGGLLQAMQTGTELQVALRGLQAELLTQSALPDPQTEWLDAMRRVEMDVIKAEQTALIEAGMTTPAARQRYQALNERYTQLNRPATTL